MAYRPAVLAARRRRNRARKASGVRFEWFIEQVAQKVRISLRRRVAIAGQFLQSKVVQNISIPVRKSILGGHTVTTVRSKKGEFPRADTTLLKNTIFNVVRTSGKDIVDAYIGTPLEYGLMLEVSRKMDRSFLLRTLNEERSNLVRIIDGPIR